MKLKKGNLHKEGMNFHHSPVIEECYELDSNGDEPSCASDHYSNEIQDSDGDWASEFLIVESPFSSTSMYRPSLSSSINDRNVKKNKTEESLNSIDVDHDCFWCTLCSKELPMQEICCMPNCSCLFCNSCIFNFVTSSLNSSQPDSTVRIACPNPSCTGTFSISECQILSPKAFSKWEDDSSESLIQEMESFQSCPQCNIPIEKVEGDIPAGIDFTGVPEIDRTSPYITEVDENGHTLSRTALKHRIQHRFRCTHCNANFCGSCGSIPYHLGSTCLEFQKKQTLIKCRYCDQPVEEAKQSYCDNLLDKEAGDMNYFSTKSLKRKMESMDVDISWCLEKKDILQAYQIASSCCISSDCRLKLKNQCTKSLSCGHLCGGIKREVECPPCLHTDCKVKSTSNGSYLPDSNDCCSVCWVEELKKAPVIQLACKHFVHFTCAKTKIEKGSVDVALNFNYLQCPLCSSVMNHPSLQTVIAPHLKLKEKVLGMAMERIRLDGRFFSAPELLPLGCFKNNPQAYALHNLLYYLCFKCKRPYYGGERQCQLIDDDRLNQDHKPEDLVCGDCVSTVSKEGVCLKGHGTMYVEYKCRYCCSVATYFCFGTTHFCTNCHSKRSGFDILPKCQGPKTCPLKVAHPPHGQEFCLGCALCRLEKNI